MPDPGFANDFSDRLCPLAHIPPPEVSVDSVETDGSFVLLPYSFLVLI